MKKRKRRMKHPTTNNVLTLSPQHSLLLPELLAMQRNSGINDYFRISGIGYAMVTSSLRYTS